MGAFWIGRCVICGCVIRVDRWMIVRRSLDVYILPWRVKPTPPKDVSQDVKRVSQARYWRNCMKYNSSFMGQDHLPQILIILQRTYCYPTRFRIASPPFYGELEFDHAMLRPFDLATLSVGNSNLSFSTTFNVQTVHCTPQSAVSSSTPYQRLWLQCRRWRRGSCR